jgi:hypothetical protein
VVLLGPPCGPPWSSFVLLSRVEVTPPIAAAAAIAAVITATAAIAPATPMEALFQAGANCGARRC